MNSISFSCGSFGVSIGSGGRDGGLSHVCSICRRRRPYLRPFLNSLIVMVEPRALRLPLIGGLGSAPRHDELKMAEYRAY